MHEIVTLQLGQRANYLATHFWNIQESYFTYDDGEGSPIDHDVHFRPGIGADGTETFLPRTLVYDLKGAFGTLRKYNALYELSEDLDPGQGLWDGREILQQQDRIPQSDYHKSLDQGLPAPQLTSETVRYWSDFSRVFYHPRSIIQLNDYELNSRTMPFEDWTVGEELFTDLDKEHDLLDRDLRPFAEECDQIRALQLFTGSDDAWGGFASKYVDRLRDEFGKKSIWVWAIEDGTKAQRKVEVKRDMNKARSVCTISPQSSLYTPIVDPPRRLPSLLHVDPQSEFYTSALICSAVETVTLPSRLRRYHDFEASLAGIDGTHKIFELQSTIVPDEEKDAAKSFVRKLHDNAQSLECEFSEELETKFDLDFTYDDPSGKARHVFNQIQVIRGFDPASEGLEYFSSHQQQFRDVEQTLERFYTPLRFPNLDSFPRDLFPVSKSGLGNQISTALTTSSRTGDKIKALQMVASRAISVDEREALTNGLGEIRESYETGWMSGSDFDDD